jgi:uncharacterized protein (TIGR04222 family)
MNPLNWTGSEFLALYVPLLLVGYVVARALGRPPRPPPVDALQLGKRLEPYEVALLYGLEQFRDAVAASLVHRGVFRIEGSELIASQTPPADLTTLERNVLRASGRQPLSRALLAEALKAEAARLRERLIQKGLLLSEQEKFSSRKLPLLVFGGVLALGFAKLLVGLWRDRPVGFLFFLLIVGVIGWVSLLKSKRGRTPLGDQVLAALAAEHESLRTTASSEGSLPTLSPAEVALAVALFGTTALASTQLASLRQYLRPTQTNASTSTDAGGADCGGGDIGWSSVSSGGSDSGGSGDSGGSSGCGGCGGGGCGGGGD